MPPTTRSQTKSTPSKSKSGSSQSAVQPHSAASVPSIDDVRASLPKSGGISQYFTNIYFHWELLSGTYSLDPFEKLIFNIFFWLSVLGSWYYLYKYAFPTIRGYLQ